MTLTIKLDISEDDLKSIAKNHEYKSEVSQDEKTITNPETDIEFASNYLVDRFQLNVEHEVTYGQELVLSPNKFAELKKQTLESIKLNTISTITV